MTPKTLQILCLCLILGIGQIIASHAEEEIINRAEPGDEDAFGHAVDVSGDTFITSHTSYEGNRGGIHIFKREKKEWKSQAIIKAPNAAIRDWFGWAVAIDSDTAVAGAYEDGGKGDEAQQGDNLGRLTDGPGAVYIYVRTGKDWAEQAKLKSEDNALSDRFGFSVDIDGDTVIIGSPHDDDAGENSGSVYIFERAGDTWKETFKIVASDAAAGDKFGWDVGLERGTAVVGAHFDDDAGSKSGSAYIFVRNADGTWTEQTKLTADDAAKGDQFGVSVDISVASNAYVIAGTPGKKGVGSRSGAAYVFVGSNGTWAQQAKLVPGDNQKQDQFGAAVAIDINRVLVGAPKVDGKLIADSGAAYSFLRVGTDWVEQVKVEAKNVKPDEKDALNIGDNFGNAVAIANRGKLAIVGARWDNTEALGQDDGSVYVYDTELGDLGIAFAVEPSSTLVTTTLGQIKRSALLQNFPNPFNPETWMPYVLANDVPVTIGIYDVGGQIVRQLHIGVQPAGGYLSREHAAYWDGKDRWGEPVSSGVYFYTLRAGTFQATRRMVILK